MVAWWFGNIAGDMDVAGARLNRYLVWHPLDHIHWQLVGPALTGVPAREQVSNRRGFGRNPDFYIDVIDKVTRLDASRDNACRLQARVCRSRASTTISLLSTAARNICPR